MSFITQPIRDITGAATNISSDIAGTIQTTENDITSVIENTENDVVLVVHDINKTLRWALLIGGGVLFFLIKDGRIFSSANKALDSLLPTINKTLDKVAVIPI